MPVLTRRTLLAASLAVPLATRARASTGIGEAAEVTGDGELIRGGVSEGLRAGTMLMEGDEVLTRENGLALLILQTDTRINMGASSQIVLASYLADVGGTINVGGAMVFDRAEDKGPVELTFTTAFGQIGVRGTRFFVGPSKGAYSVFVDRGKVTVSNAGVSRDLGPGDGVDLVADGPPGEVGVWKSARIAAAFASVGLNS